MRIIDILLSNTLCSFQVTEDFSIVGYSNNLKHFFDDSSANKQTFYYILHSLFDNEYFQNKTYFSLTESRIKNMFTSHNEVLEHDIVTNNLDKDSYSFSIGIDFIHSDRDIVIIRFANFKHRTDQQVKYDELMTKYKNIFSIYDELRQIGEFLVDLSVGKNYVHATDMFAEILDIPKSKTQTYILTRNKDKYNGDNVLIRDASFFNRTDLILNGEVDEMSDEWYYEDRWLKVDIKILKKTTDNKPLYIGGVIYDITKLRLQQDFMYLHKIYELAINSGRIGIFFYDVEKYGSTFFEANQIYADMIGLDKRENDLYALEDFERSIVSIEEEIQESSDVKEALGMLLKGEIEGTDNLIIKIKHLKTNEIIYLLSSSRIEDHYITGEPSKLGGVIIDITDRIAKEKHQIEYAYKDELTGLSNNRKLMKDMTKRNDGIGLFFDLDDFKKFNDTYGHNVGDQILYLFAQALRENALKYDKVYVYRLYGDEFFVFCEGYDTTFPHRFREELLLLIKEKMREYEYSLPLKASMGVSSFTNGSDIDDFLKDADYSMYQEKINKKKKQKNVS